MLLLAFVAGALPIGAQSSAAPPPGAPLRSILIDERLARDAGLRVGDRVVLAAGPGEPGDSAVVGGIAARGADPSEVARDEYRVRLHLTQLQALTGDADRVDRFAVATRGARATSDALDRINAAAFGFRAWRSSDIAVRTSRTFQVVSRFHRAIGVITIVASAIFLLCILLIRIDERRRDVAALRLIGVSRRTVVATIVVEAALVAVMGSAIGTVVGWTASLLINQYYQGVYRTPLVFALVTPGIVAFAVTLSLVLGMVAGAAAAARLVRVPPLTLIGR